jgi:hypothetical protein
MDRFIDMDNWQKSQSNTILIGGGPYMNIDIFNARIDSARKLVNTPPAKAGGIG